VDLYPSVDTVSDLGNTDGIPLLAWPTTHPLGPLSEVRVQPYRQRQRGVSGMRGENMTPLGRDSDLGPVRGGIPIPRREERRDSAGVGCEKGFSHQRPRGVS
jgi:hypothetical protein